MQFFSLKILKLHLFVSVITILSFVLTFYLYLRAFLVFIQMKIRIFMRKAVMQGEAPNIYVALIGHKNI